MIRFEPASFKDPAGRVFYHEDSVCRTLTGRAAEHFEAARSAKLVDDLVREQLLVETELTTAGALGIADLPFDAPILKQPRIPVVTYPYEWSFEMLRDAALVTLRALDRCLTAGFILKDATSFNVLFDGTIPRLIDAPSIEPHRSGAPWAGYEQFCRSFLFPLLLAAYRDLDVTALLRASLGEISVHETARLMRLRDGVRPGVLRDVFLHARLDRSFERAGRTIRSETDAVQYPRASLVSNVRRLTGIVAGLEARPRQSEWSGYDQQHSYSEADHSAKVAFVRQVAAAPRFPRLVDLGCNTGQYSRLAVAAGSSVVAVDQDSQAIDTLYRAAGRTTGLTPLVGNLLNPTPAMGWRLQERRALFDRIEADGFLALALIHHLRISGGIPLTSIVDQLFAIAPEGVIEWVDKDDSMVQEMLSLRPDVYDDYTWTQFESTVRERAEILAVAETHGGRRRLCHVRARGPRHADVGLQP